MEKTRPTWMVSQKVHHLCPFYWYLHTCDDCGPWEVWQLTQDCQQCFLHYQLLGQSLSWELWNCRRTHNHNPCNHCIQETVNSSSGKLWSDDYGTAQSIISISTCTAKAMGKVISEMNRRLTGMVLQCLYSQWICYESDFEKAVKYDDIRRWWRRLQRTH